MRFQDAAKDARAVVYAGIQADPLVARAAALLADATVPQRVLARAVMNGETADADVWRTMFPTLFGTGADADAAARERSEAILAASLEVADRGEQVRSPGPRRARGGAHRAAAGAAGAGIARQAGAAGPVRRGARRRSTRTT